MYSSCRPLSRAQEQNINKLAGRPLDVVVLSRVVSLNATPCRTWLAGHMHVHFPTGRKDGRPPSSKRTGKDAVDGTDPLLGLCVLFFKVQETCPESAEHLAAPLVVSYCGAMSSQQ
jgi:hypothetical protein